MSSIVNPYTGELQVYNNGAAVTPSNGSATGTIISTQVAAGTLSKFALVYLNSAGKWDLADSNGLASGMLGITTEAKNADEAISVLLNGFFRDNTYSLTTGGALYSSETLGAMTQIQPTTTDAIIRVCGYAISATTVYFNPSQDYITHV